MTTQHEAAHGIEGGRMKTAISVLITFLLLALAVLAPAIGVTHFGLEADRMIPVSVILVFLACGAPDCVSGNGVKEKNT